MKRLKRARFLSTFDPEPFIAFILRTGVLLTIAFILAGLICEKVTGQSSHDEHIKGTNVLQFLLADWRNASPLLRQPRLFLDLGIALLLFTPYLRTCASLWYFAFVERNRTYAAFTACLCLLMTYILFLG